jgi:hypothetical protein
MNTYKNVGGWGVFCYLGGRGWVLPNCDAGFNSASTM